MVANTVLVTGCNRGLGLELVRQIISLPNPPKILFATCRDPSKATELNKLAGSSSKTKVLVEQLDLCNASHITKLAAKVKDTVGDQGLNVLLNNAAVGDRNQPTLADQTVESLVEHFQNNTVATIMLTQALLPLIVTASNVEKNKPLSVSRACIINMSTRVSSISDNSGGGMWAYRISKAGLNMATKNMALELGPQGILVLLLHPGWVRTDMGGPSGLIDVDTSVSGMLNVIQKAGENDAAVLIDYKGERIPW